MTEESKILAPLDPSFQIAKELKDRALEEVQRLQLELDAAKARTSLRDSMLDVAQMKLREAEAEIALLKADRDYWHKLYDDMAREVTIMDKVIGTLKEITRNMLQ